MHSVPNQWPVAQQKYMHIFGNTILNITSTPKYLPNKNKKENQEKITLFFAKQL